MPTVVLVRKGGVVSSKPRIRSRIVENSRKVCTPRKILHFAYASFSRITNELALLVVQTNASVTSREGGVRGFRACELGVSTAPVERFVHLFKGGARRVGDPKAN